MIRKTAATAAHLTAAAALLMGMCATATVDSAQASANTVAMPTVLMMAGTTGMGGNVGSPISIPVGTVGTGGNVPA